LQPIQTDLTTIAALAEEREDENYEFRSFLKMRDEDEVDTVVHQLNNEITPKIDCTQCGNCCKSLMISITPPERPFFARHFNLSQEEANTKYLTQSAGGDTIMNTMPCIFLADNKCTVYEQRFTDCREFPHLHKPGFTSRLFGMVMYYGKCPIVFNVMEALKTRMGFRR
jgi:Fe-S-cluster containining protein